MLKVTTLVNGPLEENCYLLSEEGSGQGILIDPGSSAPELEAAIRGAGVTPVLILATHAHFDHVGAVDALAKAFRAPFACHGADAAALETVEDMAMFYGLGGSKNPKLDRELRDNELIEAAGLGLRVLHTPGHTPGGVCFHHAPSDSLFSGDTLFRRSIGRSDFEGGDAGQLVAGIKARLFSLPPQTRVYPGHGPSTSIGEEMRENPFAR